MGTAIVTKHQANHRRPVWRGYGQGLNAGLFVIRDGYHAQGARGAAPQIVVNDFDLLVNMQHVRHFGLKGGIPALHIVPNLVRPKFALTQDLVQFGPAQRL